MSIPTGKGTRRLLTRWEVPCPKCHANPWQPCTRPDGKPWTGYHGEAKFHTARQGRIEDNPQP